MGSNSKYLKCSCKSLPKQSDSRDRISNLPDEIVAYILSFLPTKEAARTSILSKRYLHVWHFITSLDFDDHHISRAQRIPWAQPCDSCPRLTTALIKFIYWVLHLRKGSSLCKFHLDLYRGFQAGHVNSWIDYALKYNVEDLDISVDFSNVYSPLSLKVFAHTRLTVLKLKAEFLLNIPIAFCLPTLKILHLSRVQFPDDYAFTRFVSNCPVLEELDLRNCNGNLHVLKIIAPLKRLVSNRGTFDGLFGGYGDSSYKIIVNAPSLLYLEIIDSRPDLYAVLGKPKLVEAKVIIYYSSQTSVEAIVNFLNGISSSLQSLYLRWRGVESMMMGLSAEVHLPKFPRLKYLSLCVVNESQFLAGILQNSPNLEELLYVETSRLEATQQQDFECETIPTSLKFVRIEMHAGLKSWASKVDCFLNKAKVLEKLILRINVLEGVEQELLKMVNLASVAELPKDRGEVKINMKYSSCQRRLKWKLRYVSRCKRSRRN